MKSTLNYVSATIAALGLSVAAASAADVVYDAPPAPPAAPVEVAPVASWGGAYLGAQGGYGFSGDADLPGVGIETDGFVGGVFGGYNWETGNGLVYGIEADVNYSDVSGGAAGIQAKSGVDGALRARIGSAVTPDVLVYAAGGVAAKNQKIEAAGISEKETMVGWTAGVGTDVKLTENVFARGEYRYTDYGDEDFDTFGNVESKDHRVMVGVGVKF
ncbi:outer membrane protein [Limoniibacter endophyticus]|uniref:Porin n=1 Tax=Limoniibacter endophyticus TaxID=1565040 RepID=A0A8J3GFS2_9HYPH|nr:outer membrane beta-barrel protein [Limoniibacter endophyticus]GHC68701.1 porin [Limoniibacter endophyticus]